MPSEFRTDPVRDTVPQINNELAVGEDLAFQRKWWRFEHIIWAIFTIIVILDLAGALGRGPVAKASMKSSDGRVVVKYERIERYGTPSFLTIHFDDSSVRDGQLQVWVSQEIVNSLGAQRVIPQPATSTLVASGMLYTFPAGKGSGIIQFQLQPTHFGRDRMYMRVGDSNLMLAKAFIMP